jgi:Rod binding domain-containing protein
MESVPTTLAVQHHSLSPRQPDNALLRQPSKEDGAEELRDVFDRFVGETFFGQLLSSMRKSVEKPAYFHGGRAEEVWQGQLDQLLTEQMSAASAASISDPMFELFTLDRVG